MKYGLTILTVLLGTLLFTRARADAPRAHLLAREQNSIAPAKGDKLAIPFALQARGAVTITLYTGDGDRVRVLRSKGSLAPGKHELAWDGRDERGQLVPDEAYHPVLSCTCGGARPDVHDPREGTGGVVIDHLRPALSPDGTIAFDLPMPARVLVRLGMKGGAMMRALETWSARPAGRAVVTWDGEDQSHVERLLGKPGLTVLVTAFSLPDHTILTSGHGSADYFAYRTQHGWSTPLVRADPGPLERAGKRLSRQASLPRSALQDPQVSLTVVDGAGTTPEGAVRVKGPVTFRVDIPQQDKWLLQQSLYEVGFFLDQQFVSEEETGFTPLSWRWLPADLTPGLHTMTVNVSGLWGQVGVASVRLSVGDK